MIRNGTFRSESLGISYFGVQIRDSGHVQVAIYTVFHVESESEVKTSQFRAFQAPNSILSFAKNIFVKNISVKNMFVKHIFVKNIHLSKINFVTKTF